MFGPSARLLSLSIHHSGNETSVFSIILIDPSGRHFAFIYRFFYLPSTASIDRRKVVNGRRIWRWKLGEFLTVQRPSGRGSTRLEKTKERSIVGTHVDSVAGSAY